MFAPNLVIILFININNIKIVACVINEDKPNDNILNIFLSSLKSSLVNFTDFIFPIYIIAIKNDTACPITVAIAPPFTPILNPKINIGSNIIFITAPITNIIIEYLGDPSALIIFESAEYISINGAPSMIIFP